MKPIVAIVGRPNVGKSTLFNRLTRTKMAIVEDYPGVTRDRLYQDAEWNNRKFTLIDTGGIEVRSEDTILAQVRTQAQVAMEEADVIIFMCDIKAGVTNEDMEIANMLRRTKKDVILAVNKVEDFNHLEDLYEFYSLGLDEPYPISASHGMNTGDLLDRLMELIDKYDEEDYEPDVIKIAVVGRPNVGKSSLTNAILGQERAIVSNIPGTTRDAIDTPFERNGQQYVIIDTAGMRRKSKVAETTTERYSVIRSLRAVDRSDVVLMVINAEEGLIEQDKKIVGYAHEQGKAIILVVNKWDLIEKDDKTASTMEKEIRSELLFLQYAPMIFVSAMTKQRVHKLIDMINFGVEQNNLRISTSVLNEVIRDAVQLNPPPSDKGKRLKIYYATQSGVCPPTFVLFVNEPEIMHFSYERFLENKIRENFGFEGTPIRIVVRKRSEDEK
ncbi:MAG: ribosome biogenesis GTPase Der [Peptococcaceae bacterium]|nr:ribosome biogenesis GTPase Der [Peptococcaceae bacterium]MBO5429184.1 ribosome biogenesis GTPase Der [Peptococcaceae bacterium]MBP3341886.1 ribosome biogenesis GTPase Der [Peptococcaceae bacterium]MBP3626308.1 ribosome biogenesis GTPase Der [Peptococcaceae bacterium]MBQ2837147.1 ribosome biogenesis GTPase Der [Peptococcaceae bacterium]